MSLKLKLACLSFCLILPLDQASKAWVVGNVSTFDPISVIPGFFQITHARNSGGALGLFQDTPVAVFVVLTLLAIGLIVSFYRRVERDDHVSAVALGLILAGAVGNLIDRLFRGGRDLCAVLRFLGWDCRCLGRRCLCGGGRLGWLRGCGRLLRLGRRFSGAPSMSRPSGSGVVRVQRAHRRPMNAAACARRRSPAASPRSSGRPIRARPSRGRGRG